MRKGNDAVRAVFPTYAPAPPLAREQPTSGSVGECRRWKRLSRSSEHPAAPQHRRLHRSAARHVTLEASAAALAACITPLPAPPSQDPHVCFAPPPDGPLPPAHEASSPTPLASPAEEGYSPATINSRPRDASALPQRPVQRCSCKKRHRSQHPPPPDRIRKDSHPSHPSPGKLPRHGQDDWSTTGLQMRRRARKYVRLRERCHVAEAADMQTQGAAALGQS
ncbi:hypothetical protein TraAM80_03139 [Trypanosoma rangeli]|uniref:Uncharacterized protein n=1 Tax=Trypanosoma rangeli TaxID=5698 RepID=A0A3R7NUH0_TRYRA|nr:uncharacterized protein TraAM80_03139 [Trypanosoma rangeli]RNF07881.1 hypothetical protein TraAM80_03139 [Trypanosoma rangeli]|eukprot:RNF07881.1 hypothetical protein TraAM80_03139 [Trypanosoma rangeli]